MQENFLSSTNFFKMAICKLCIFMKDTPRIFTHFQVTVIAVLSNLYPHSEYN
jgi:hypothetical protein